MKPGICPCCGGPVKVHRAEEGTASYEPLPWNREPGIWLTAEEAERVTAAVRPHACTWRYGCSTCREALALLTPEGSTEQVWPKPMPA